MNRMAQLIGPAMARAAAEHGIDRGWVMGAVGVEIIRRRIVAMQVAEDERRRAHAAALRRDAMAAHDPALVEQVLGVRG